MLQCDRRGDGNYGLWARQTYQSLFVLLLKGLNDLSHVDDGAAKPQ